MTRLTASLALRAANGPGNVAFNAETLSLTMHLKSFDVSPLDPFAVAQAVGREAQLREHVQAITNRPKKPAKLKTPSLLGCWVNGVLKFQTRDHDELHAYAERKMQDFRNNVWVAPVGSFIDAKQKQKLEEQ